MEANPFAAVPDTRRGHEKFEPTVSAILREAVITPDSTNRDRIKYLLYYGSKILEIFFHPDTNDFVGIISTDDKARRLPDETSLIYAAGHRLMATLTNKLKEETRYNLITENTKLKDWALGKGSGIFKWDAIKVHEPESEGKRPMYQFTKIFRPQKRRTASAMAEAA
ncbi:hypothetical protein HZC53_05690 [Candidatus Uhrbacteria bacterium]|nr:hypothetical protein [Candidatus Uhrbacteria bacterium]